MMSPWARRLIVFGYALMFGVAGAMAFLSGLRLYLPLPKALPFLSGLADWPLVGRWPGFVWLYLAFFAALVAAPVLFLRRRTAWGYAVLILSALLLGAARYFQGSDISGPSHITHFLSRGLGDEVLVRGTITQDPDHRERYVFLTIAPEEISTDPGRRSAVKLSGRTGEILLTVYPSVGDYYWRASYGDRVEVLTALMPTRDVTNPTGFNYGSYLRARNIWAVSPPRGIRHAEHLRYLGPGSVSFLVKLSLRLKQRFIESVRRTIPYPESALFGGITIGLRAGLPPRVNKEFLETGTAHILSVSGLHVSFVYALLLMLCRLFFVPRRMSFFLIVFGLVVFNIITGSAPATQRSVLMASMIQGILTFGGMGLYGSAVLTLPTAGMLLLLREPLLAPDGSFVLSIVAIWALAHLSGPVEDMLRALCHGWKLAVLMIATTAATGFSVMAPGVFQRTEAWVAFIGATAAALVAAERLDRIYPLQGFDFFQLPRWFTGLAVAQAAIVVGMNLPMSALFFQRYSVSGTYANFLAIPLSGVITQLALVAGGLDLAFSAIGLDGLGRALALCLNATNWYLCKAFMAMMTFFSHHFPYPYIPIPSRWELIAYFSLILGFVFWQELAKGVEKAITWARTPRRKTALAGASALLLVSLAAASGFSGFRRELEVLFFDCGMGNAVLIRTPGGRAWLVDAGPVTRSRRSMGESVLAPALAKYNVRELDGAVLSAPRASQGGGFRFVAEEFPIRAVHWPLDPAAFSPRMSLRAFLAAVGDETLRRNPHDPEAHEAYVMTHELLSTDDFRKRLKRAVAGDVLLREKGPGGELTLRALWPPAQPLRGTPDDVANNAVVLKLTYGETSFLLAPQLAADGEWALLDAYGAGRGPGSSDGAAEAALDSDWILAPGQGDPRSSTSEFVEAVSPSDVVIQTGYVNWRDRRRHHPSPEGVASTADRYARRGARVFRTDAAGAVIVSSDGRSTRARTVLPYDPARDARAATEDAGKDFVREVPL
jgi:competence protein ComEC